MSELLRAFLDANCVSKNPAFYMLKNEHIAPVTGTQSFGDMSVVLQCKADSHFLCMGWAFTSTSNNAATVTNTSESFDHRFEIVNLSSGMRYELNGPANRSLHNFNLNNFVTLPQYPLFRPGDLIQAQERVIISSAAISTRWFDYVNLVGVEYRMKG